MINKVSLRSILSLFKEITNRLFWSNSDFDRAILSRQNRNNFDFDYSDSINYDEDILFFKDYSIILDKKQKKDYVGNGWVGLDNSLSQIINAKSIEEIILQNRKNSFIEKISHYIKNNSSQKHDYSNLSEYELRAIIKDCNIDSYTYDELFKDFSEIKYRKKLIRTYERKIKSVLRSIRIRLINFKEIYRKQHSFHFKNLDDTHARTLINKLIVN